jgi:maltose O-acetyltransferase
MRESLRLTGAKARRLVLNDLIGSKLVPVRLRWRLLNAMGMRLEPVGIAAGTWFGGVDIAMGENSGCNIGCVFDNLAPITIGRNVGIGHQVMFLTSTHEPGVGKAMGREVGKPIVVGDGAWIGARATIMPGVTIGAGATIGVGSVVTKDCEPGGVYAGVPARLLKTRKTSVPLQSVTTDDPASLPA